MDDRACRRIYLLAVDRERRASFDDDVDLLVTVRLLGVVLDDLAPDLGSGVGVHSEGLDPETAADRMPLEPVLADRERLELGEADDLEAHDLPLSSSSTTGSICPAPSTRSSRFWFPAQRKRASASSPS